MARLFRRWLDAKGNAEAMLAMIEQHGLKISLK